MTFEMLMEEKFEDGIEKGIAKGREEGIAQGIEKGIEQGAYNTKLETAKNLLTMSLSLEKIAKATGLPLKTVIELKNRA